MENSRLVRDFISHIWNNKEFEMLDSFLHCDFRDYSLPPMFDPGKDGTRDWIINTGISFEHHTIIEDQVTEGDKSMVKLRMKLKHIGIWRNMEPTGKEVDAIGYRYFRVKNGRIIEHWALIDGQGIESQLRDSTRGFKISR